MEADKAGPKMDAEVARSVGLEGTILHCFQDGTRCFIPNRTGRARSRIFEPSTDLNATLEAAEVFGLFHPDGFRGYHYSIGRDGDGWKIERRIHLERESFTTAPTMALAICGAILKLSS